MKLLPEHIEQSLPPMYAQQRLGLEAIAYVRYFTPWSRWAWYATEYDRQDRVFFGLIVKESTDLGFFSLAELDSVSSPGSDKRLRVRRDTRWTPCTLARCRGRSR